MCVSPSLIPQVSLRIGKPRPPPPEKVTSVPSSPHGGSKWRRPQEYVSNNLSSGYVSIQRRRTPHGSRPPCMRTQWARGGRKVRRAEAAPIAAAQLQAGRFNVKPQNHILARGAASVRELPRTIYWINSTLKPRDSAIYMIRRPLALGVTSAIITVHGERPQGPFLSRTYRLWSKQC